ncbi:MAG: 16S rRNA (guanine(966)-N(2))-methyltransferase RsmD [Termitinemataceae bacterium]|nr:MAG: 16S rRNA (guanine(966)-N(2))-methyltransferase RsmD [Termitinemataceae bacterium]
MRITGGTLLGRHIEVPKGIIRPAMDRMRESVFAILGDIIGKSFLDLFTGSGIIALEAASRGATDIEAVEMDALKRQVLLKNVGIAPVRINCRFMAVELYVKRARRAFDYIFCDPPFPYKFKWELAESIAASPLMRRESEERSGSMFIMHRPREDVPKLGINDVSIPNAAGSHMILVDQREYGRSIVDFWRISNTAVEIKTDESERTISTV